MEEMIMSRSIIRGARVVKLDLDYICKEDLANGKESVFNLLRLFISLIKLKTDYKVLSLDLTFPMRKVILKDLDANVETVLAKCMSILFALNAVLL